PPEALPLDTSARPDTVTTRSGHSPGSAGDHRPVVSAATARAATGTIPRMLMPLSTPARTPRSVARAESDTARTRDRGSRAGRARRPRLAPRPRAVRERTRRRAPPSGGRGRRRPRSISILARQQAQELPQDAGGGAPDHVLLRDPVEVHEV